MPRKRSASSSSPSPSESTPQGASGGEWAEEARMVRRGPVPLEVGGALAERGGREVEVGGRGGLSGSLRRDCSWRLERPSPSVSSSPSGTPSPSESRREGSRWAPPQRASKASERPSSSESEERGLAPRRTSNWSGTPSESTSVRRPGRKWTPTAARAEVACLQVARRWCPASCASPCFRWERACGQASSACRREDREASQAEGFSHRGRRVPSSRASARATSAACRCTRSSAPAASSVRGCVSRPESQAFCVCSTRRCVSSSNRASCTREASKKARLDCR